MSELPIPADALEKLKVLRGKKVVITGGCGFLGRHLAEFLLKIGCNVRVFDLRIVEYSPAEVKDGRLEFFQGNLTVPEDVERGLTGGFYALFHTASPPPTRRDPKLFQAVNVDGTKLLLEKCKKLGVTRFVYTSTASVVFNGKDQKNLDERIPLAHVDDYTTSKAQAEAAVLAANDSKLQTCALRPHVIFGPRDVTLLPAINNAGVQGKWKYIVGDGTNLTDVTYVDNLVYAHLLAIVNLNPGSPACGQAYFITDNEPILFWDFMSYLFQGLKFPTPFLTLPLNLMLPIASVVDQIAKLNPSSKPTFTSQTVRYTGCHHYYNIRKIQQDIGYWPIVPQDEAIQRTIAHFKELSSPKPAPEQFPRSTLIPGLHIPLLGKSVTWLILTLLVFLSVALGWHRTVGVIGYFIYFIFFVFAGLWLLTAINARSPIYYDTSTYDLKGQVAIITGGNRGLGKETALAFAKLGARVIIACRDEKRAEEAVLEIKQKLSKRGSVEYLLLDLASFKSVRDFVTNFKKKNIPINYLILNAGIMVPATKSVDGIDVMWQTNYFSHFLLTQLLLQETLLAERARILHISSLIHYYGHLDFRNIFKVPGIFQLSQQMENYGNTKLAQILFSNELQRQLSVLAPKLNITSLSIHPGTVDTDFILHFIPGWLKAALTWLFHLIALPAEAGIQTTLYAALSRDLDRIGGVYLDQCKIRLPSLEARQVYVAKKLWDLSFQTVGLKQKYPSLFNQNVELNGYLEKETKSTNSSNKQRRKVT